MKRSIRGSLCVGVFFKGEQVGFARVISDCATFAYLCDVYVLEEHRGRGIASWMLEEILAHPKLQGLRRFTLATRDAHTLYARRGFAPLSHPESFHGDPKAGPVSFRKSDEPARRAYPSSSSARPQRRLRTECLNSLKPPRSASAKRVARAAGKTSARSG